MEHLEKSIKTDMLQKALLNLERLTVFMRRQQHPKTILLGGQPGAGKSSTIETIGRIFIGDILDINGDDFREFYPDYSLFMRENPAQAVQASQPYTNFVVESLIDYFSAKKYNLIVEGTMRSPSASLNTAKNLIQKGYKVSAHIVVANCIESRIGCLIRREKEISKTGYGRPVSLQSHDDKYRGLK